MTDQVVDVDFESALHKESQDYHHPYVYRTGARWARDFIAALPVAVNPTMTRDELVAAAESIGMRFPTGTLHTTGTFITTVLTDEQRARLAQALREITDAEFYDVGVESNIAATPRQPNDTEVICPACTHQFRAIPEQVQRLLLDAGIDPPFGAPSAPREPCGLLAVSALGGRYWPGADDDE